MAVITVPKTPKSAFKPGRPLSGLLKAQLDMLEAAAAAYHPAVSVTPGPLKVGAPRPAARKATVRRAAPRTEAQAARRIADLHAQFHQMAAPALKGVTAPSTVTRTRGAAGVAGATPQAPRATTKPRKKTASRKKKAASTKKAAARQTTSSKGRKTAGRKAQ